MSITATELKNNLSYYLALASENEIFITQYGKVVAILSNPDSRKLNVLEEMKGFLGDVSKEDLKSAKLQELSRKCGL